MFEGKPFHYLEPFDESEMSSVCPSTVASSQGSHFFGYNSITPISQSPTKKTTTAPDIIPPLQSISFGLSVTLSLEQNILGGGIYDASSLPPPSQHSPPAPVSISQEEDSVSSAECFIPKDEDEKFLNILASNEDEDYFFAGFKMPLEQYYERMGEEDDDVIFGQLLEEVIE